MCIERCAEILVTTPPDVYAVRQACGASRGPAYMTISFRRALDFLSDMRVVLY